MKIIRFLLAIAATVYVQASLRASENPALANISGRGEVTAESSLIAGFVLTTPRRVLIRAAGPGIPRIVNYCKDPVLTVFKGATAISVNEDWDDNAATRAVFASVGAFPFAPESKDCAVVLDLDEGEHTAVITCSPGNEGVALVEVYEIQPLRGLIAEPLKGFVNLSLRGKSGPGEKVLIAGFVMGGSGRYEYLLRALGPGLERYGIPDFLPDPKIVVRNESGILLAEWDNPGPRDTALVLNGATTNATSASRFLMTVTAEDVGGRTGTVLLEANDRLNN